MGSPCKLQKPCFATARKQGVGLGACSEGRATTGRYRCPLRSNVETRHLSPQPPAHGVHVLHCPLSAVCYAICRGSRVCISKTGLDLALRWESGAGSLTSSYARHPGRQVGSVLVSPGVWSRVIGAKGASEFFTTFVGPAGGLRSSC